MPKFTLLCFFLLFCFSLPNCLLFGQTGSSWPIYRGNNSLNGSSDAIIFDKLNLLWSFETGDKIESSPVIHDGLVFFGSTDGNMYALDLKGKLKWKYKSEVGIEAHLAVVDNMVIAGSLDGTVYSLDYKSGKLIWKYQTEGQINGSVNYFIKGNLKTILVPSYDFFLHGLEAKTGKLLWKYETENYLNGAPAINKSYAVFGGCDAKLHIVNPSNGKSSGIVETDTYIPESIALQSNCAYGGNYNGLFFCIDLLQKKMVWKFNTPSKLPFMSSPAVAGGKVVIGNHDKKVYCFDAKTGSVLWTFQTQGKIESSPVIARQKVIICSTDGLVRLLSLEDGKSIASYEIGVSVSSSPAVVDYTIIVGAENGTLYAIGAK